MGAVRLGYIVYTRADDDEEDRVIYIGADIYTRLMTSDCAPLQMQILRRPNKRFVRGCHYNTASPREGGG